MFILIKVRGVNNSILFYTISNGKNNMASYAAQITVEDRWAVVAYVKALQEAGNADASAVPGADSLPERKMVLDDEEAATTTDSDATEGAAP